MARRKYQSTRIRKLRPGGEERIRIPQPEFRPVRISSPIIDKEKMRPEPWWFQLHRRGLHRPWVGTDPDENRAVSEWKVHGTLLERIEWRYLVERMDFNAAIDFNFQSSLLGGRLELGGIVADFLFPYMKIVLNVQGPTHKLFLRGEKDKEQRGILEEMGFTVFNIDEATIRNPVEMDNWHRDHFYLTWNQINPSQIEEVSAQFELEEGTEEAAMAEALIMEITGWL